MTNFYELEEPTRWAGPPEHFSFSSLQAISSCPRRWQLLNSEWGEYARFPQRLQPKALEGTIVHEAIELLVRALGKRGLPSIGSDAFREALSEIDFWGHFARESEGWNRRLAQHPRMGPSFHLKTPARELANRAIRLFREQYEPLDSGEGITVTPKKVQVGNLDFLKLVETRGAISEVRLEHPDLPFLGIIDMVEFKNDGIKLTEFKTGKPKEEHLLQLQLYAVLWWRTTGNLPNLLSLQYVNDCKDTPVSASGLVTAEKHLAENINESRRVLSSKPAEARPASECGYCPVRARCTVGWQAHQAPIRHMMSDTTDVALTVVNEPAATGFSADLDGREVSVVFEAGVGKQLIRIEASDHLRLVDVLVRDGGKTFEIRPWTEVYRASQ